MNTNTLSVAITCRTKLLFKISTCRLSIWILNKASKYVDITNLLKYLANHAVKYRLNNGEWKVINGFDIEMS